MSNLAMAYQMKKKMAKGGMAECMDCKSGSCMAHGGEVDRNKHVKGVHKPIKAITDDDSGDGDEARGTSTAGILMRQGRGYSPKVEKERGYYADAKERHKEVLSESRSMPKGPLSDPKKYAEGGDVMGDDDLVMRIMKKRYAQGGAVEPVADFEPNDFDEMDLEPAEHFHETGANSGDEDGDEAEDDDRKDIVSKIMKSRKKKDKLPRPA